MGTVLVLPTVLSTEKQRIDAPKGQKGKEQN